MNPFGLSNDQLSAFSRPVLEYLPAGFDAEAVTRAEVEEVESLFALASLEVVEARIARMKLTGDTATLTGHLTERLLETGQDRITISGLRYRNLDPGFPFVAIKTTARIDAAEAVEALAARVTEAYRGAGVRGFTFWEEPGLHAGGRVETWATVVAGSLPTAAQGHEAGAVGDTRISWPDTAADVFGEYQREHHAWRSAFPDLAPFVPESDEDELEEAANEGRLMVLEDDHGFAGLAAATSSTLFGRPSIYMIEMFLAKHVRGQGLAPVVESLFLAGQRSDVDTVWGHIHAQNVPSLRTAEKLRREAVQQEYFVDLTA